MKIVHILSVLAFAGAFVSTAAWAEGEGNLKIATAEYVEQAYGSLDNKKQDKINNADNAGVNIIIDDNGKINLDLAQVAEGGDGVYVLTATISNGTATLKWERITRETSGRDGDMLN